nr:MAG TPA: Prohead core protein serine protease [Caudoviricetes sp.]
MKQEGAKYYLINQCVVDPDVAMANRKVISENTVEYNGTRLFTVTYNQVLQDFGVRNWNGRIYDDAIVMKAIDGNPLIQNDIKMGTWTAEYGHPIIEKGMNELARQMTIFPPNACNTINKYWREGNYLMGECTTLAGGYGEMVRDRILTNYPAMASSRAIGGVDKNGHVLPGYTVVTFDTVIRPSHKVAYQVRGSEKINEFPIATSRPNTMTESAVPISVAKDPAFKDFLLSESASREQINMLCDTFSLDYNSISISENAVTMKRIDESGVQTIVIPIHRMVNADYFNLF